MSRLPVSSWGTTLSDGRRIPGTRTLREALLPCVDYYATRPAYFPGSGLAAGIDELGGTYALTAVTNMS